MKMGARTIPKDQIPTNKNGAGINPRRCFLNESSLIAQAAFSIIDM